MIAYIEIVATSLLALCVGVFLMWGVVKIADFIVWLKMPADLKAFLRNEQIAQRQVAHRKTRAERLREKRRTR